MLLKFRIGPFSVITVGFRLIVSCWQLDNAHFVSAARYFQGAADIELFHEIGSVGFDRLDAYFKFFSDLLGAKAFGHGLEDFSLTIGKSAFLLT